MTKEVVNWAVRFGTATAALVASRIEGRTCGDDAVCREHGFDDARHYWKIAFSEPMEALRFVALLEALHEVPWITFERVNARAGLKAALLAAWKHGEPWIFANRPRPPEAIYNLQDASVRPREAALWLASHPKRRHLVEGGLLSCLQEANTIEACAIRPPSTGPRPYKRERVKKLFQDEPQRITESAESVVSYLKQSGYQVGKTIVADVQREYRTTANTGK